MPSTIIDLSPAIKQARVTAIKDAIDGAATAGRLQLYDGTRPAAGGAATNLLAEITLNDPCGTVSGSTLTFDIDPLPQDASANMTGTATWARFVDGDGVFCADCNVGATGSGEALTMNSTALVAGVPVTLTSAAITEG